MTFCVQVKIKMQKAGCALSEETKTKIAIGVRVRWQRRRERLVVQKTCFFEWQNLVAEAARGGFAGEMELQWDSYDILNKQLEQEWLESIKKRKMTPKSNENKRAPKPPEQRRKIVAEVAAKWAEPGYHERVCARMAKYHDSTSGEERKARRKPSSQLHPKRESKKKVEDSEKSSRGATKVKPQPPQTKKKSDGPSYKDPLALSKLEMIKNIRAQRVASDMKRHEALERAKLLIAEARAASKALEAAARSSPIARASLIETKKLINEAVQYIQSIENVQFPTSEPIFERENEVVEEFAYGPIPTHQEQVNGIHGSGSSQIDSANFVLFMQDSINGRNNYLPTSFMSNELLAIGQNVSQSKMPLDQPDGVSGGAEDHGKSLRNEAKSLTGTGEAPPASMTVTKKWVRGRLVDVAGE
ncbi:hypothetical protein Dimus_008562 [Dionaea muscipula]